MRKIQCEACAAQHQCVVCDLPPEALDDFRAAGTTAIYKPRQVLFCEGSQSLGLYLVCQGAVKLYHSDRFGRTHILEVAGPGALLGELALDESDRLSVSGEAITDSQLCFLPRERLAHFLQEYPGTAVRLLAALSHEVAAARRKVRDLALKGAESRLAGLLLQHARASGDLLPGKRLQLRYTRRELAEMIGVSTETAIRLLGKLKHKGAVTINRREIVITSAEKLVAIAQYTDTDL